MCFAASKDGFKSGCRRLVEVDGCHLKTKRGGQLLVVVAIDPNNNIFPLAYVLVEIENKETWEWFLKHLSEYIMTVSNEDGVFEVSQECWTFMSDKQKGLIKAFKIVLSDIDHRFCVRHLHENFKRAGFKGHTFKIALWTAATSTKV
ncbi:hypothetical protein LIER_36399 [Lithospermum erythrorhizon]|uniref:MULE transposase domain-containing protein n=1 Tax=Lithospermum erythrorhizon TaxID=34254 RepID=A0AAV3P5J2_LITER